MNVCLTEIVFIYEVRMFSNFLLILVYIFMICIM